LIGVGEFARRRAELVFPNGRPIIAQILHPSPANPQANRAWAELATNQLVRLGVWNPKQVSVRIHSRPSKNRKRTRIQN
jgi:single-strand selective monofunctional uracil DNA glycosylase